ncbi:MAG TPA: TolC family protein [Chitinophagaceae bacterium]|nr:TolC family protein [Chitinophagaceae bacterium]
MKTKIIIAIAFCFTLVKGIGQTVTLNEVLDSIQKYNPSLKVFGANIRSLDAASKGARSWMPPELGTGFWMTPYNVKYWKGSNGSFGMGQYMISAMQQFPNRKRQDAEESYLRSLSTSEKDKRQAAANTLYAEAKANYYQWLVLKKKIRILTENEKLLNFMIKDAEVRYKNGLEKISAYYKAKAALGYVKNMQLIAESEIKQHRIQLNTLMNRERLYHFEIDTTYSIKNYLAANFDTTILINSRSDIKAIDKEIEINNLQQNFENAKLKPEFGLRYDHMFGFGGLPMQFTLLATVKLPMAKWSSRAARANIESLQFKTEALNLQKQSIINEASGIAFRVQNDIELKKAQLKLFEENIIPALRKNYQTMQLGYGQNTEDLFTLFDAWQTLNMTQLEYLNQLQELLSMQVELEKTLEIEF